ncbi:MAG TPA: ATP-binding protein [Planctomycetes bacterium]|nr:ATP-binding protein [Fuerstiella sp.]HIK92626.1 ATP-binding protein [Planctomycetota bacterium]
MFGQAIGKSWFFSSSVHTEAVSRLLYVAEQGEPFVFLQGEHGCGKSTLLKQVQAECSRFGHSTVLINLAALDQAAFLWHLCGGLSIVPRAEQSQTELMSAVRDELVGRSLCNHRTVILLDDFARAAECVAPIIDFLAAINQQTDGAVSVIAAAEYVASPELQRLSALKVRLRRLTDADSSAFAVEFLQFLSVSPEAVAGDAVDTIVEMAEGSPAHLTRLCQLISVAVEATQNLVIDAEVLAVLTEETLVA